MDPNNNTDDKPNEIENAARILFSPNCPENMNLQLVDPNGISPNNLIDVFEAIQTLYLEGLSYLFNSLEINFNDIEFEHFQQPAETMRKIKINVRFDFVERQNKSEYANYFNKIVLRNDPEYNGYFVNHPELSKNYTFLVNGRYARVFNGTERLPATTHLEDLYCIFIHQDVVYKISFELMRT